MGERYVQMMNSLSNFGIPTSSQVNFQAKPKLRATKINNGIRNLSLKEYRAEKKQQEQKIKTRIRELHVKMQNQEFGLEEFLNALGKILSSIK